MVYKVYQSPAQTYFYQKDTTLNSFFGPEFYHIFHLGVSIHGGNKFMWLQHVKTSHVGMVTTHFWRVWGMVTIVVLVT